MRQVARVDVGTGQERTHVLIERDRGGRQSYRQSVLEHAGPNDDETDPAGTRRAELFARPDSVIRTLLSEISGAFMSLGVTQGIEPP
jgi:hypothetical protein